MKKRLLAMTGGASAFPLVVLLGLNATHWLDQSAFSVLLPDIRDSFGLDLKGILTLVAFVLPVTILLGIPVAFYADRSRRTRLALIGAVAWSCFSVATGLAWHIVILGIARAGSALGATVNEPTHNSLLSDYYAADVRAKVYGVYRIGNSIGMFAGPVLAGVLATVFTWRMPFLVFAIPTATFVALGLRLQEPKRGVHDRLAMGVSAEDAEQEETPPSFGEAWRVLYAVRSLRRIYYSLPFVGTALFGQAALLSLFLADVYHVGAVDRGLIIAFQEIFSVAGILVGAPVTQRLMNRDAGRAMQMFGASGVGIAAGLVVVVLSPNLVVAVVGIYFSAFFLSILFSGIYAVLSLSIPARTRSLGFVSGTLWFLPGVVVLLPIIGSLGDTYGLRVGLFALIPFYLVGYAILGSSGRFLAADIEAVRIASMTENEVRKALAEGDPKLLLIRKLDVAYSQVQVLFEVDFDLHPGEIVALLGTNGAGKSTLLKAISGLVDPVGGAIYFDGLDITHADPFRTSQLGIVQMPGGRSVFPTLTVDEHLRLAARQVPDDPEHARRATEEVLTVFPRLRERIEQQAGNLSGGEQQMLGIGMALIAKPTLLMIDELSLGLAPTIVEQLLHIVRRIHAQGTSIILVEQSVNVALTVAQRAYFMEKGEVRFSGPTAELLERDDILRAVFLQGSQSRPDTAGEAHPNGASANGAKTSIVDRQAPPILRLDRLTKRFGGVAAVNGVSFDLLPNEILGLIGPNGAGKTTVFDLISGFLVLDDGTIHFNGEDVTTWSPDRRARAGLGRSFQDARIFPSLTVAENLAVSLERHLDIRDHLADAINLPAVGFQEDCIGMTVEGLIELMNLEAFRDKFVAELSTGSRRIVDLAMAIAHQPSVLILDEPSSGIAQRESEALGPLLLRIRDELGCAMLVIEHDMPLITGVSDRMIALELGTVLTEGDPVSVITDPAVVESYLGGDLNVIKRSGALAAEAGTP